jgi:RimJ/RimL family protein N-acetyltransferase
MGGMIQTARRWAAHAAHAMPGWLKPARLRTPPIDDWHVHPRGWGRTVRLQEGRDILIRPLRPEDDALYPIFLDRVTPEDRRLRFFAPVREFTHARIEQFTHVDFERAMAFAALEPATGELAGVARLHRQPDQHTGEFAILVRSDLKGHGLGWILMTTVIEYGQRLGLHAIEGDVLAENDRMLKMCGELGFRISNHPDDSSLKSVWLPLGRRLRLPPRPNASPR